MIPTSQPYDMLREFLRLESAGGILLVIATVFALILANSAFGGIYEGFLQTPVVIQIGALEIAKPPASVDQ
jgi:NhaA family Na+:H+ antiporter